MIMRIQLIRPHNDFVSPQVFNRMFTMHGTTMVFFVAMPVLFGFANYLVPLMIGARDMAFPRLNAFSFWLTALGGAAALLQLLVGGNGLYGAGNAPDVGWWAYAPLTAKAFSPGHSSDLLDNLPSRLRLRQHRHGNQYHRDNLVHPLPWNDAQPNAAACLAQPGDVRNGVDRDHSAYPRRKSCSDGSLFRRAFFRHAGGRLRHDLDALLLDFRTSGSLHPDYSLLRFHVRNHSGIFAQSRFSGTP